MAGNPVGKDQAMATRSIIAAKENGSWVGVYHHWDGYPSALGVTLVESLDRWFGGSPDLMASDLVWSEDARSGWSTIVGKRLDRPAAWHDGLGLCRAVDAIDRTHWGVMRKVPADSTYWAPQSYRARGEDYAHGFYRPGGRDYSGAEWLYIIGWDGVVVAPRLRYPRPGEYWGRVVLVPWGVEGARMMRSEKTFRGLGFKPEDDPAPRGAEVAS